MQNQHHFENRAFQDIFQSITNAMPSTVFFGILLTYGITVLLNVHFIPLPKEISIPAALAIQFGRFAVVFMDFLNPTGKRSQAPPIIATIATIVALIELGFSIQDITLEKDWTDARYWSVFLFGAMLISFGYILEMNFIAKGAEAYGMKSAKSYAATTATVTQRIRNAAESVTPQQRPVIAGFQHNEKVDAKREKSVETNDLAPYVVESPADVTELPADVIGEAIKKQQASLRAYRYKLINGIGKPETAQAGIARATARISELESML
jgi:hypothetical protein